MTKEFSMSEVEEIVVDNFAGGGGASQGMEEAGLRVDEAINHDGKALGMHRINHPTTVHHCEDVFDIDPAGLAKGRRVGFGWFSPDCKHFSKAKGGKPLDKKIRGLVLVMLRWAAIGTRVMTMENVEEIRTWGPLLKSGKPDLRHKGRTWLAFLAALGPGLDAKHPDMEELLELLRGTISKEQLVRGFGYVAECRELRACDYGTPTIRKRLFMVARCDGHPIVWPEPTHAAPALAGALGLRPHRAVAECIDWDIGCPSIFLRGKAAKRARCRRPLAHNTLRRVATGVDRFVLRAKEPFTIVNLTHQGGDRCESAMEPARTLTGANRGEKALAQPRWAPFVSDANRPLNCQGSSAGAPMNTLCAEVKGGHFQVVAPVLAREFGQSVGQPVTQPAPTVMPGGQGKTSLIACHMVQRGHKSTNSQMVKGADEPMRCQCSAAEHGLVAAHLTKFTTGSVGQEMTGPAPTVVAGSHSPETHGGAASTLGMVAASMVKLRGDNVGSPVEEPAHTASAGGQHHALSACYLAQHNGGFNVTPGHDAREPLSTISAKGSQQQVVSAHLTAYYGSETDGQSVDVPVRTIATKPRFGLTEVQAVEEPKTDTGILTAEQIKGARRVARFLRSHGVVFEGEFACVTIEGVVWVVVDIGLRMLTPRELFRAQGFPEGYVIDEAWLVDSQTGEIAEVRLTKEEQIRMCGNSVCPPLAAAIVRGNVPELIERSRAKVLARGF